jgi:rhomboid family GlyGly-CTERM serine protease
VARQFPVTLAIAALCLLLALGGDTAASALAWRRAAIADGEAWRLWTGHLVHFSLSHGAADVLALLATGMLVEPRVGARRFALLLAVAAACISAGLLACAPALQEYRGASGLAMLAAALAASLYWHRAPGRRQWVAGAALLLAAKIAWEAGAAGAAFANLPAGVSVAWQAHLLGAVCGLAACGLLRCRSRLGDLFNYAAARRSAL